MQRSTPLSGDRHSRTRATKRTQGSPEGTMNDDELPVIGHPKPTTAQSAVSSIHDEMYAFQTPVQKQASLLKDMTNVRKSFVRTVQQQGSDRFSMYRTKQNQMQETWVDLAAMSKLNKQKDKRMMENHKLALKFLEIIEDSLVDEPRDQKTVQFIENVRCGQKVPLERLQKLAETHR